MAKVKVELEPGEHILEADIALFKALNYHASGDAHLNESFDDPAMVDVSNRMLKLHEDIYKEALSEILEELDKEYQDGY